MQLGKFVPAAILLGIATIPIAFYVSIGRRTSEAQSGVGSGRSVFLPALGDLALWILLLGSVASVALVLRIWFVQRKGRKP